MEDSDAALMERPDRRAMRSLERMEVVMEWLGMEVAKKMEKVRPQPGLEPRLEQKTR